MNIVTITIRPGMRTVISKMPWEGKGGGYRVIGATFGASRQGQVKYAGDGAFSVARPHTNAVIFGLAARYGQVRVIQYGGSDKCVESCWLTGDPAKASTCECLCAGENHGSRTPYAKTVGRSGPGGALSVQARPPREYYVQ